MIVFEFFASLERQAGSREYRLDGGFATVGDALAALVTERPDLATLLERCACASGDAIVRRADTVPHDRRIAVLPPVAGG